MNEITEGVVDYLEIESIYIKQPKTINGLFEMIFVMTSKRLNEPIYGRASCFPEGSVVCRSYSELTISDLARKRLRKLMTAISLEVLRKLR